MTDKNLEGNPGDAGAPDANPPASQPPSQPLGADFAEVIGKLQKKIDAQQGEINALKSGKDAALDRIEKDQKDTFARIAKHLNVDEEVVRKAQRELALDDLVAERLRNPQPSAPIGGTVAVAGASAELQLIDELLDLPANDSRVTDLKLKYGSDPAAYGREAKKLKGQLSQTQPPTPGEMPLPQGQARTTQTKTVEQLMADYQREMLNAPRGRAGDAVRRTLKEKAIKDGVPVDSIVFV